MQSTDLQVLTAARRWAAEGRRFALVTVARTWGSAPRPPGAWLALREDGVVEGSVSGGCIEDDLIARMREGSLAGAAPFKLVYGVTKEEATRFRLPCGGTLELVVEPAPDAALLEALAARLATRQLAARRVDLLTGTVTVTDARRGHPVGFARQWLDALAALAGDEGARGLLQAQGESVTRIDVDDPGCLFDVDTPGDLEALVSAIPTTTRKK